MIVFMTAIIIVGIMTHTRGLTSKEAVGFQQYLSDKYNGKFVVTDIQTKGAGLGIDGYRSATVHPEQNPNLVFNAFYAEMYEDNYPDILWRSQLQPEVLREVQNVLPEANATLDIEVPKLIRASIHGAPPTADDAAKQNPQQIQYILRITSHGSLDEISEQQYNNIFTLIAFLKSKENFNTQLGYIVYQTSDESENAPHYSYSLTHENILTVNGPNDVSNYLHKK